MSPLDAPRATPQQRALVTQRNDETTIRECAPLCLAQDSGWGGVSRGWAWIDAADTMGEVWGRVKIGDERGAARTIARIVTSFLTSSCTSPFTSFFTPP